MPMSPEPWNPNAPDINDALAYAKTHPMAYKGIPASKRQVPKPPASAPAPAPQPGSFWTYQTLPGGGMPLKVNVSQGDAAKAWSPQVAFAELFALPHDQGVDVQKKMFKAGLYGDMRSDQIHWGSPGEPATMTAFAKVLEHATNRRGVGQEAATCRRRRRFPGSTGVCEVEATVGKVPSWVGGGTLGV
jgi:hypothetical protein